MTPTDSAMQARRIGAAPAAQPALPDDLLEDIFLRLDEAADLVRTSASCTSFRRIVSARCFLRRYRSLHRPPVLGFFDSREHFTKRFYTAEPPHRSAPAAAAVARDADFTFPFISDPSSWRVRDVRDGRILLSRLTSVRNIFGDLIVCDPLHRRHIQVPPIPQDLIPSAVTSHYHGIGMAEPFLDPVTEKEKELEDDLPFRVICNFFSSEKIQTVVFSSVTGEWLRVTSFYIGNFTWLKRSAALRRHYAFSCFCWTCSEAMLVLETREMKFSIVDLPPVCYGRSKTRITIVEAREGRLGLLILGEGMLYTYSKTWPNNGDGVKDWRYDNAIPLADRRHWSFGGGAEGCTILEGVAQDLYHNVVKDPDTQYFTVYLKTLPVSIKKLCATKPYTTSPDYLYASFPLSLSLPSLRN